MFLLRAWRCRLVPLSQRLAAIASSQRMRIIAELMAGQTHVSQLARRVGMSRALLYMHLNKLEEAGFVHGHLVLSDEGKALKLFELSDFSITITPAAIAAALPEEQQP
jgi:DNA-binding transcriptional ArsR family regulator